MILSSSGQFSGKAKKPGTGWLSSLSGLKRKSTSHMTAGRHSPTPSSSASTSTASVDKFVMLGTAAEDHGVIPLPGALESPNLKPRKSGEFELIGTKPEDYGIEALGNSTGSLASKPRRRRSLAKKVSFDKSVKQEPTLNPAVSSVQSTPVNQQQLIVTTPFAPPVSPQTPPPPGFKLDTTKIYQPRTQFEIQEIHKYYVPYGNFKDDQGVSQWIVDQEARRKQVRSTYEQEIHTITRPQFVNR